MMNRFKEQVLQAIRGGEDFGCILNALEALIYEMKKAEEYLEAYNEKDFAP